jgi:uncharacterized membrane protein YccC
LGWHVGSLGLPATSRGIAAQGLVPFIGALVGAAWIVALSAWFPQDRVGFLTGLALWAAVCACVATLLRNFASYAAALAGFTAAILASDTKAVAQSNVEPGLS